MRIWISALSPHRRPADHSAMGVAVASPPSTWLSPCLDNSYRCFRIGSGLRWLLEHAQSIEDVQVAESHEFSQAVGYRQTQQHALGSLRIRMGAAQAIGRGNVGTTYEVIGRARVEQEVAHAGTTAHEFCNFIHI